MIRAFLIILGSIALIFAAVFFVKAKQFTAPAQQGFPPVAITTAPADSQTWERAIRATGSIRASQGVLVAAEVAGTIREIHFGSGQEVEKGDLLIVLDDSTEQAQLKAAQASANLANVNLKRSQELFDSRTISQSEFDRAEATAAESEAQLSQIKSVIDKKRILAPFSGTLGIRLVDVGEYLTAGASIVSLQQLDPIYVDFSIPQIQFNSAKPGYALNVSVDAFPDTKFTGEIEAVNPNLDVSTRTVRVRGTLQNPNGELRPGMFGTVGIIQPQPLEVVAIPSTAVYPQAYGNSIFVIKNAEDGSGKIAEQRFVTLGTTKGDFVQILDGLEPEEEVATAGVFKLNDGSKVVVDNSKAIEPSLNPTPDNA